MVINVLNWDKPKNVSDLNRIMRSDQSLLLLLHVSYLVENT